MGSADERMVIASGLRKAFGSFVAVGGIDFEVRRGEVFGFLGPNGAGKTSTMRMIACVSPASSGELRVLGLDPATDGPLIRSRIGVVPQEDNLDTELSVRDNFMVYGRYFGLPRKVIAARVDELLEFARLSDRRDDQVDPLSGGMKRRLTIARALVNQPELVLLDEPTTGLDPQARQLVWDRLYGLKQRGVTLILTTHYMDEAEQMCDRLVVMDQGRIIDTGSPRELIDRHVHRDVVEARFADDAARDRAVVLAKGIAPRVETSASRVLAFTDDAEHVRQVMASGATGADSVFVRRATLEDVFLTLTGRALDE